jgi:molybdopterin-guanine dinucleotide biosynthesis protein
MTTEKTQTKMSLEETMKQIELETEAKVIEGYKTGDIQLPKLSADGKTLKVNNQEHEINILKNIMAEGAKKFEAASGRQMTYTEMRQMFG